MAMARLHMLVEGSSEERFCNLVLVPHLACLQVFADARRLKTGVRDGIYHKGGTTTYAKLRRDLVFWMREDSSPGVFFSTMIDLFCLPSDFPKFVEASRTIDPYQRIAKLEAAFAEDIGDHRFVPYLQLHEFEALVLVDPRQLLSQFPNAEAGVASLEEQAARFASPELINDDPTTAPSKRISAAIPGYTGRKASAGPLVAMTIGLERLRSSCRHFGEWLERLESLSSG